MPIDDRAVDHGTDAHRDELTLGAGRNKGIVGLGLGGFQAVPALISLAREETVDGNILVQFVPVDSPRAERVVGTRFAGRRE